MKLLMKYTNLENGKKKLKEKISNIKQLFNNRI